MSAKRGNRRKTIYDEKMRTVVQDLQYRSDSLSGARAGADCVSVACTGDWGDDGGVQRDLCGVDQPLPVHGGGPDCSAYDAKQGGPGGLDQSQWGAGPSSAAACNCGKPAGMDYHAMILTGHDIPENVDAIGLNRERFRRSRSNASSRAGTLAVGRRRGTGPASSHRAVLQVLADTFPFGPERCRKNDSTGPKNYLIVGVAAPRFRWYSAMSTCH